MRFNNWRLKVRCDYCNKKRARNVLSGGLCARLQCGIQLSTESVLQITERFVTLRHDSFLAIAGRGAAKGGDGSACDHMMWPWPLAVGGVDCLPACSSRVPVSTCIGLHCCTTLLSTFFLDFRDFWPRFSRLCVWISGYLFSGKWIIYVPYQCRLATSIVSVHVYLNVQEQFTSTLLVRIVSWESKLALKIGVVGNGN